jgi:hypothetical protein
MLISLFYGTEPFTGRIHAEHNNTPHEIYAAKRESEGNWIFHRHQIAEHAADIVTLNSGNHHSKHMDKVEVDHVIKERHTTESNEK